jgi:hypothetical protein
VQHGFFFVAARSIDCVAKNGVASLPPGSSVGSNDSC